MSIEEFLYLLDKELRHETLANCLKQPVYLSGKALSSEGKEITVVLGVWEKLSKEMRLEPGPTRTFITNFASTISCFLTSSGSWQLVFPF